MGRGFFLESLYMLRATFNILAVLVRLVVDHIQHASMFRDRDSLHFVHA